MNARRAKDVLLLAAAYFAAARLSLIFAIPPGYATVVWPTSGLALAALWIWGFDLWPGIFLGSFAANAATVWIRGPVGTAPLLLAAWIGAGSSAQALIAASLARRATGGRDPLIEERDLFRFFLIAGPLACLTASLWGTAGLLLFKAIGPAEAPYSWATWWVGDSVGVAFAAPLVLLWSGRGPVDSRRGKSAVTAVLLATMATVAAIHAHAVRSEETLIRARAEHRLADASGSLRTGLAESVDVVRSAADLFESRAGVSREEFGRFARAALRRHPAILALDWQPRVADARRGDFERSVRAAGPADFALKEVAGPGQLRPRARAAEYFPALYAEPAEGAKKIIGLDVGDTGPVRDALNLALRTGQPAASAGLRLVLEPKDQLSVVILVPVKTPGAARTDGIVAGVYRVCDAMDSLLAGSDSSVKGLRVVDVTDPAAPQTLDSKGDFSRATDAAAVVLDVAGRRWRVDLTPADDFQSRKRSEQSWLVLARALILMYLTSWVVLTLYGRAERIAALVELKTSELREQERRLLQAQKMESVGRLAGGIAHEFNNILMAASALAQLVQQSLGPEHPSAPDLEGIVSSIKRAGHLVSQLLTYSRKRESRMRPTDLHALIARLSKMLEAALGRRIALELAIGDGPIWIMADAGQVEQVVLNLCFNARDAVDGKGRIRISVRPSLLKRRLETPFVPVEAGRYVLMEISDDGPGIPDDIRPNLLEPFFTTKAFGEGSGLGLSVVSGIVRQHGGGLDIGPAEDKGTQVAIYWPESAPVDEKTPVPEAAAPRGSGLILIVDDDPMVCSTLERVLEGYGYRAISAVGGEEALAAMRAAPDVRGVVLDLMMPRMDGLETYDRMLELRPDLKVLFLSGYAPRRSEEGMKRRGVPFLAKPADAAQLAAALHDLLEGPRA